MIELQYLQALFGASPDGIAVLDGQGTITQCNPSFATLCGEPENTLIGQPLNRFWQSDQTDKLASLLRETTGEQRTRMEVTGQPPGGLTRALELHACGLPLQGAQLHMVMIRDISRQQRLTEEFRYQKLALDQHAIVSIHNQAGHFSYVNDNLCRRFGYTREELLDNHQQTLRLGAQTRQTAAEIWTAVSRTEIWQGELQLHTHSGDLCWLDTTIVPFQDSRGGRQQIAISTDITARKKVEIELQSERDFNASVLNALTNLVVVAELDGRVVHVNDACIRLSGFSRSEFLSGEALEQLLTPSERQKINTAISAIPTSSTAIKLDTGWLPKNSDHLGIKWTLTGRNDDDGNLLQVVATGTDTTNQALLESQLRQSQKMEVVGRLTGGIAHDFNNILVNVLGYSQLALRHIDSDSKRIRGYLTQIEQAGQRAREMISQLQLFSRVKETQGYQADPGAVLNEVMTLLKGSIPANIRITTGIAPALPRVQIEPINLHQLIMNLCVNAQDAITDNGHIDITLHRHQTDPAHVAICSACQGLIGGDYVVLGVQDTGCGIPPETVADIFDPFFTTKVSGEGTGLGLSVVHGTVHEAGGHINVHSAPDQGTLFQIFLPVAAVDQSSNEVITPDPLDPSTGTGKIMVVDDDTGVASYLTELLELQGYQVTPWTDSAAALAHFTDNPECCDLLLTDQTMPGLTGLQLAAACRMIRKRLPIIMCTGFSAELAKYDGHPPGVDQLLIKPVNPAVLINTINQALTSTQAPQEQHG